MQYKPPSAPQRTNVFRPDRKVWSATFGAYCVRGYGITACTSEHPDVVKAVHRLAQTRKVKTPYLAFQITRAPEGLIAHRDGANFATSDIIALGTFKGGHLLIESAMGRTKLPPHYHSGPESVNAHFTKYQIRHR
eukprot:5254241-Amphidinium_carterae.1